MTQGTLLPTGKDYDVAIRGEGFFKILLPDGRTAYTRDGSFEMDAQGRIVTAQGNRCAARHHDPAERHLGIHQRAGPGLGSCPGPTRRPGRPDRARDFRQQGRPARRSATTCILETPASGTPQNGTPTTDGFGNLQQGNLEQANVEAVSEISDLIAAQRAYEMNAKVITAADQMLSATSNLMR